MFDWQYFIERNGLLYTESGERHEFDGAKRTAEEWDHYFGQNNIRASVERSAIAAYRCRYCGHIEIADGFHVPCSKCDGSRTAKDSSLKKTTADTGESSGALAQSGGLGMRHLGQTGSAIYESGIDYGTGNLIILFSGQTPSEEEIKNYVRRNYGRECVETESEIESSFRGLKNPGTIWVKTK
jgi:hypothetical protein